MGFSSGRSSVSLEDINNNITEDYILNYYLGVTRIPCVINSPLRKDDKPSFGLYTTDGYRIHYTDLATGEKGGLYDLLSQMWNLPFEGVLEKINNDLLTIKTKAKISKCFNDERPLYASGLVKNREHSKIEIKIREWRKYDLEYWESYGINLSWLQYADVFPISHKIITKEGKKYTFGADKYAYAYLERKEGNVTFKIYQPFNKDGFKWCNTHDASVISLWTKVPQQGEKICICSSLKDALCLWINTGIPSIAIQGEGYSMSDTAISELKRRYKEIYILLDNDAPGLQLGRKLSLQTGFPNIVLPQFEGGKDISDLFHILQDKNKFNEVILPLFNINH